MPDNQHLQKNTGRHFNLFKKKRIIALILILVVIPFTVVLALTQQRFYKSADGAAVIERVDVQPGLIIADINSSPVELSTLAYDIFGDPIRFGATYEWSMSSTNSVGTLASTEGEISKFTPTTVGCGELTVIATVGVDTFVKSVHVTVKDGLDIPLCSELITPTPTIDPNSPQLLAKIFILRDIRVCNASTECLDLELNDNQVADLKAEVNAFRHDVYKWSDGKLNINPVFVEINEEHELNVSQAYDGWWIAPDDARELIKNEVTKETDFVFLINGVYDEGRNERLDTRACDLTASAASNAIGTSYTWMPVTDPPEFYNCAEKKTIIHGLLHQLDWDLHYLNEIGDIYNNTYNQTMCTTSSPEDNYKWFPDPDQADKIPGFEACINHYNDWAGYCSSIKPRDCDYEFDEHLLRNHFPEDINFIGNHCRDGIQNYGESDIDYGYPCGDDDPIILDFQSVKLHGIGSAGDNTNPNLSGNPNPIRTKRDIFVELENTDGFTYKLATASVTFNSNIGDFSGVVELEDNVPDGSYLVKVKSPQFLKKQISGIISILKTKNSAISIPVFSLVTGDIDGDNAITLSDYNMLIDCYSDLLPAKNCDDDGKKMMADLSDDGEVNADDYNLFLRELSVASGD